jgi:hypothetical protein
VIIFMLLVLKENIVGWPLTQPAPPRDCVIAGGSVIPNEGEESYCAFFYNKDKGKI